MATIAASDLFRPGLLQGVSLLLAGASPQAEAASARTPAPALAATQARAVVPPASFGASVSTVCGELGARVSTVAPISNPSRGDEEAAIAEVAESALAELESIEILVVDAAALFAAGHGGAIANGAGGEQDLARAALRRCLQDTWSMTRAVVNVAFLARQRGGRIVYLAPAPGAGEHACAACAGLENLARTLSIEWARHAITVVTIAPGDATSEQEVAALTAYLASPAGCYFSGCLLDLRGPAGDGA
jgi:citronellol/citronellal dehydrogenase